MGNAVPRGAVTHALIRHGAPRQICLMEDLGGR